MAIWITVLNDGYLTQTEKRSICQMIEKGLMKAENSTGTKRYVLSLRTGYNEFDVKISTLDTWTLGRGREWRSYNAVIRIRIKG